MNCQVATSISSVVSPAGEHGRGTCDCAPSRSDPSSARLARQLPLCQGRTLATPPVPAHHHLCQEQWPLVPGHVFTCCQLQLAPGPTRHCCALSWVALAAPGARRCCTQALRMVRQADEAITRALGLRRLRSGASSSGWACRPAPRAAV